MLFIASKVAKTGNSLPLLQNFTTMSNVVPKKRHGILPLFIKLSKYIFSLSGRLVKVKEIEANQW